MKLKELQEHIHEQTHVLATIDVLLRASVIPEYEEGLSRLYRAMNLEYRARDSCRVDPLQLLKQTKALPNVIKAFVPLEVIYQKAIIEFKRTYGGGRIEAPCGKTYRI